MCCVRNWQVLKSSGDNSTIQFEYSVPLSDASSVDHARSVEERQHALTEAHSRYNHV